MKLTISILLILATIALTGCGKTYQIDPQAQSQVDKFFSFANDRFSLALAQDNLIVQMGSLDSGVVGDCQIGATPTVTLNTDYWSSLKPGEQEALVFHELGHCMLGRMQHRTDLSNSLAISVMYPQLLSQDLYEKNYNQYIYELFTKNDDVAELPLSLYKANETNFTSSTGSVTAKVMVPSRLFPID